MYIRVTSRCNMLCGHCLFSCINEGEDMTLKTWKNVLKFMDSHYYDLKLSNGIFFGGGEPTLNNNLRQMCLDTFILHKKKNEIGGGPLIGITTNGSNRNSVNDLIDLAKKSIISLTLSNDRFHQRKKNKSLDIFQKYQKDFPNTINIKRTKNILRVGRARKYDIGTDQKHCLCPFYLVEPNGDFRWCACEDSPVLFNINLLDDEFDQLEFWHRYLPQYSIESGCNGFVRRIKPLNSSQ